MHALPETFWALSAPDGRRHWDPAWHVSVECERLEKSRAAADRDGYLLTDRLVAQGGDPVRANLCHRCALEPTALALLDPTGTGPLRDVSFCAFRLGHRPSNEGIARLNRLADATPGLRLARIPGGIDVAYGPVPATAIDLLDRHYSLSQPPAGIPATDLVIQVAWNLENPPGDASWQVAAATAA